MNLEKRRMLKNDINIQKKHLQKSIAWEAISAQCQ